MTEFPAERWFESLVRDLNEPLAGASDWPPSPRHMLLEALSDASAEQLLNPLVAMHLRRFGREWALTHEEDRVFWVRGEWEKVDVSYGVAQPFPEDRWNEAWWDGRTGDLGQIEVKVCYTHRSPPIGKLHDQLAERRRRDEKRASRGHQVARQRYHGLVCLFEHGGVEGLHKSAEEIEELARRLGLAPVGATELPASAEDLGTLWPSYDGRRYRCGLAFRLFELG